MFLVCSTYPPGLRAQFLDHTPSGFWITNVNNTFVGNTAVGHTYGFWIRVDLVFSEPGYPCTTCSCPETRVSLPTIYGSGLVMVDNVAHSSVLSGIWIKENWVPFFNNTNIDQWIEGFVAYKNGVGLEVYGIGTVHFNNIIAADNTYGVTLDWERKTSTNWTNVLIIGETENHGNPENWPYTTNCSKLYPGIRRTKHDNQYVYQGAYRLSDERIHMKNVTMMNYNGCYAKSQGALVPAFKAVQYYPPDSVYSGLKFANIDFAQGPSTNACIYLFALILSNAYKPMQNLRQVLSTIKLHFTMKTVLCHVLLLDLTCSTILQKS